VISTNPSLNSLELGGLKFNDFEGAGTILNAIKASSIETLDFSSILIQASEVEMLEEMLTSTVSLTDLTFGPEDNEAPLGPF
jgi:hypothetical protein